MSKGRILAVEDEGDIANMLKIYFTGQGYDIQVAARGGDALKMVQQQLPQLMVLDINLPDIDGYTLCKQMRTNTRTKHIPIIFLTEKDERGDRIAGLELGADDYITKPFDIEELRLRIANAIRASERMGLTDPRSGLPSGRLIEDGLREAIRKPKWAYMDLRILDFDPFRDKYGFVAGDEALRFTAMLISEIVDSKGSPEDFIGHAGNDNFILITYSDHGAEIRDLVQKRFNEGVKSHYSYVDREQGGVKLEEGGTQRTVPLMTLSIGMVTSERDFSDIREITEAAAQERRKDFGSGVFPRSALLAGLGVPPPAPTAPPAPPEPDPHTAPTVKSPAAPRPSPAAPRPSPAAPSPSPTAPSPSPAAPRPASSQNPPAPESTPTPENKSSEATPPAAPATTPSEEKQPGG